MSVPAGISLLPASAGTGKTWNIAEAVLDLVLEEKRDIRRLVIVTFSEAAARELRDRVRRRFAELRRGVEARGEEAWDPTDKAMIERVTRSGPEHAARAWQALVHFDEACIDTIHGFCSRVLLQAAFECGAPLGFELVAKLEPVITQVVEDFWIRHTWAATPQAIGSLEALGIDVETLADLARKAADPTLRVVPDSPGEVEAPDVRPWNDALADAHEIWKRDHGEIKRLLVESPDLVRNKRGYTTSLPPGRTRDMLETVEKWWRDAAPAEDLPDWVWCFSAEHVAQATLRGRTPPEHPFFTALDALRAAHAQVQPALRSWRLSLQHSFVGEVRERMKKELARRNALTFDELLRAVRDPVMDSGRSVRAAIRARYELAIVDEFQDTDGVQWDIFRTLFDDRLYLVGDPKQAIYSFRGGDFATYRRAEEICARQNGLTENFRTDDALVKAVHHLFARPGMERPFVDPRIEFPLVTAHHADRRLDDRPPLHVRFLPRAAGRTWDKKLTAWKVDRDLPAIVANDVVRELQRGRNAPGDCAVLTRTNKQAAAVASELQKRGVPATVRADAPVTETPEHKALLDVLRAIEAPLDTRKVRTALLSPLFGMTAAELVALQNDSDEWIAHTGRFRAWNTLWATRGILATVQAILDAGSVAERLLRQGRERSVVNVRHLGELLQQKAHLTPSALLSWVERKCPGLEDEELAVRLDTDATAVQVVTVHGAKGLEYPLVWVPFLLKGGFLSDGDRAHLKVNDPDEPGVRLLDLGSNRRVALEAQALAEQRAEDLRLAYVALTRAQHRCVVYWGVQETWSALGWLLHQKPGMTEDELGKKLIYGGDAKLEADLDALAPVIPWDRVNWAEAREVERFDARSVEVPSLLLPLAREGEVPGPSLLPLAREGEVPEGRRGSDRISAAVWHRAGRLDTLWRRGSFTGLTRGVIHEWRVDTSEGDRVPLADVRGGARFGTLVHSVLEEHDFRSDLTPIVSRVMGEQSEVVAAALTEALRAPLFDDFTMARVGQRFTELAFHLPVADPSRAVSSTALASLFDGPFADRLRALEFVPLRGFLVGSIDLVFRHGGRWYVVDWKTNDLGATWSCYDRAGMHRAMLEHLYALQYHLYTVALARMLRARVPGFDYERDFGGVLYLFLRGMSPAHPGSGVFRDRPSAELIERLDALLAEGT